MIYHAYRSDRSDLYIMYLSNLCHLDHDLSDISAWSNWSNLSAWSIWFRLLQIQSICPINLIWIIIYLSICSIDLIWIMICLIYLSDMYVWSWTLSIWSNRSLWIRSWSAWHICPINLIWSIRLICLFYTMTCLIHLSNLVDLDHHLSVLSVRSIWHIMIYLSDLYDLDHNMSDPSVRSIWLIAWSILSICPIYIT